MKKRLEFLLFLITAFLMSAILVSCGNTDVNCTQHVDEDGNGICDTVGCGEITDTTLDENFNANRELYLFKNGEATFQFVIGEDVGENYSLVADLANTLSTLSKSKIKLANTNDEKKDVEILIGSHTNRGNEYKFNKYELGHMGYTVRQVGTKIIVIGGSEESTATAIKYLKETVFGIKRTNDKFTDKVMAKNLNCTKLTNYKVTSVSVGEAPLSSFAITYTSGDNNARNIATELRDKLYTETGIRCEVMTDTMCDGRQVLIRSLKNDGEGGGFYVNENEGNLIIECEFQNKFKKLVNDFFDERIFNKSGDIKFNTGFSYEPDLRKVTYESYGANGQDMLDDFAAIKKAHDDANENLLTVWADPNATYYLTKESGGEQIKIKTNTYWGTAKFIIVDSDLTYEGTTYKTDIFHIASDNTMTPYKPSDDSQISLLLKDINDSGGIQKNSFTSMNLGLNKPALVYIYNEEHRNYIRFGVNKNNGRAQKELVYLNSDGTISSDTHLLFDYNKITKIEVLLIDERKITVDGGEFTTIANQLPCETYVNRGIKISRSGTTIQNVKHYITGEGESVTAYRAFLNITNCTDVTVTDCILTGHRAYTLAASEKDTTLGTYDLSIEESNRITLIRVTQSNFFLEDGKTPTVNNGYWGIMASNFSKNITYDRCMLSRFDAHMGMYNGKIIDSTVSVISIVGGGEFELINSKVYPSSKTGASIISLRTDYGSTWNGTALIKDVEIILPENYKSDHVSIIQGSWNESALNNPGTQSTSGDNRHSFGYDCYMPYSVTVDNLSLSSPAVKSIVLASGTIYEKHEGTTIDKYHVTKYYEIKNNQGGYVFLDPREVYTRLTFVIDGVQQ